MFNWRRLAREGGFGEIAGAIRFAPAIVTDDGALSGPVSLSEQVTASELAASSNDGMKLNDVDRQAWLADVLARINDQTIHRLNELLPWNWALAMGPP